MIFCQLYNIIDRNHPSKNIPFNTSVVIVLGHDLLYKIKIRQKGFFIHTTLIRTPRSPSAMDFAYQCCDISIRWIRITRYANIKVKLSVASIVLIQIYFAWPKKAHLTTFLWFRSLESRGLKKKTLLVLEPRIKRGFFLM